MSFINASPPTFLKNINLTDYRQVGVNRPVHMKNIIPKPGHSANLARDTQYQASDACNQLKLYETNIKGEKFKGLDDRPTLVNPTPVEEE
jgi:hypothetical protein